MTGLLGLMLGLLLLLFYPVNPILVVPLLVGSAGLILVGVLKRLVRKRRFLAPLGLATFTLLMLATLAVLFLAQAPLSARLLAVLLLMISALATLRAFYIWGPRRTDGLSRYYDF